MGILQARILEWVPCTSPGHLPNPEIELGSPALQVDSLAAELPGKHSFSLNIGIYSYTFHPEQFFICIPLIFILVFSFISNYFMISLLIFSLTHLLFKRVLFNCYVFVSFLHFPPLVILLHVVREHSLYHLYFLKLKICFMV